MTEAERDHWEFSRLSRAHDRESFRSGVLPLDDFLKASARQNAEAGVSTTMVATRSGSSAISGFFTLRMGELVFAALPPELRKRLPRYPVPVVHLARLAVDERERCKGLGELLLMEALARGLRASAEVPALGIEVVAKDAGASRFYAKYGFVGLVDDPCHLYLSMKVVEQLLG